MEVVKSIVGLYDEKVSVVSHNLNSRRVLPCFFHQYIHGHLRWDAFKINNTDPRYGGHSFDAFEDRYVEYCEKCLKIKCVHQIPEKKSYEVELDKYQGTEYVIGECIFCGKRLLLSSCALCNPSQQALNLINGIASSKGISWAPGNFNSWYFCEFPLEVSYRIDNEGSVKARIYVEKVFEGCSVSAIAGATP